MSQTQKIISKMLTSLNKDNKLLKYSIIFKYFEQFLQSIIHIYRYVNFTYKFFFCLAIIIES